MFRLFLGHFMKKSFLLIFKIDLKKFKIKNKNVFLLKQIKNKYANLLNEKINKYPVFINIKH